MSILWFPLSLLLDSTEYTWILLILLLNSVKCTSGFE